MPEGAFIVLEGIDGAGTTTQVDRLAIALRERGVLTVTTREPSGGPVGTFLRRIMRGEVLADLPAAAMALLFAADRLDHLAGEVEPNLARGAVVLCDRYDLSTLTYQSATHPEGEHVAPWLRAINSRARRPDLTIVLDVPADIAEKRRAARGGAEELFERRELQAQLAGLYAQAERLLPGDRIVHVDGNRSPEEVAATVLEVTLAHLDGPGPLPSSRPKSWPLSDDDL